MNFDLTPSALFSSTTRSSARQQTQLVQQTCEQGWPDKRTDTAGTQEVDIADCCFTLVESPVGQSKSPHNTDSCGDQADTIMQTQNNAETLSQHDSEGECNSVHDSDLNIFGIATDSETDFQSY